MAEANDTTEAFWEMFAREHWESRPGVFRALFSESSAKNGAGPLISSAQAFAGVLQARDLALEGKPSFIRFFLENALVQSRLAKYLPAPEDVTFEAFAKRIRPLCKGEGFGLTVNGFAHHDFKLFTRVRRFLRGLYERVGMPGDVTDLDVFIGNYRHTPFGIHTDKSSNFCVVFEGTKKFLVWPGPVLDARRDMHHSVDFEDVRDQAIVLEGSAGDIIYWPSSYWHIAESSGELSAVMNVSLYLTPAPSRTVPWDPAMALHTTSPRDVRRAWLTRTTAYNIHKTMPDMLSIVPITHAHGGSLPDNAFVEVDSEFPIAFVEDNGALMLSAHGHVIEVPAVPKVIAMIQRLNSGVPIPLQSLIADTIGIGMAGGVSFEVGLREVESVLENLLAMRAISIAVRDVAL